ncbi:glutathione S-transferase family protein [Sphingobium phenoxybenzoativorans]|uniref:Glutathione S-transferase family protein n=1 Tax=Sphingobium phenoxybenzoativorans TaxID=1592790 RepID=A0A975Q2E4_9SPHN|nr:glutathione S-transferase family protein [Sphingobium phenoxybenzoativorans]QUT06372.1 glutathione S-transferase family protein [Sphingobium phenoxybenzoativorans]
MPVDANAEIEITGFAWVPDFARGFVRDLRPRWACEEAGIGYRERLINFETAKGEAYRREQPFGQVPAYRDNEVQMFESGAMVLRIAERSETLMPRDAAGRARILTWVTAALNSVEPFVFDLVAIDTFNKEAEWAKLRRPEVIESLRGRLGSLANWLGGKDYLEGDFSAADIIMATVLREVSDEALMAEFPTLTAYRERCVSRPAFQRAMDAQLSSLAAEPAMA